MESNENTEQADIDTTEDTDVEGHRRAAGRIADTDDDVEGHRRAAGRIADTDDDDVEGHRYKKA